jgi:ribosomal protein S18 acetylase RimI-like enzyme
LAVSVSVSIRPATPADRQFVLDLADRLVDFDVPAWRPKPELIEGDRRALREWFDALEQSARTGEAIYIAELDGRPAGCAYLVTLVDYFNLQAHAHLSVLAVARAAEGKGVGSALLDKCVEWARERGSDRLTLSALVTNARARALYERRGYGGEYIRYCLPL